MSPVTARPTRPHQNRLHRGEPAEIGAHGAEDQPGDGKQCDERQHRRDDEALVKGAHDGIARAKLDEVGSDDRSDDAGPADRQRIEHRLDLELGRGEDYGAKHHGGDDGNGIGLEQIGRHAGAIANVVADVVGNGCGIARIVFRNAGFDLADHVAADVGALGEYAAAEARKDGNQRGAEAQGDKRVDDRAAGRIKAERFR